MAVHDAGATVRRCVESLQGQTLANFELVAVDAGSDDDTLRQLEALAERDMRVRVVQAGPCSRPDALNLALERARGRYVLVMDSRGWAERTMLKGLVDLASEGSLELAMGGFAVSLLTGGGRSASMEAAGEDALFPTQHDFRAAAWGPFASGQTLSSCAKLFLREYLVDHEVRFSAGGGFDHAFVISALADVERVGALGGVCCHVGRRLAPFLGSDAAMGGYRRLEEEHDALLALYRHWGLEGDAASMDMLQSRYIERLLGCIEGVCGKMSRLPSAEQRRIVATMIETDRAQVAASVAHPRGSAARAMLAPIRSKNAALVCVQTRLLSFVSPGIARVTPDLFA